ncbi:hypothetical protein [Streptomyces sp. NPDC002187]|uniref:hypothetical protein n=1 Tax=Streptomyces sp. NPDC002187 TaxID=3364637 RepID=UPI0036B8C02C
MSEQAEAGTTRHLVLHDYGMGGVWWWVWAHSAQEIVEACAEVEVVTDADSVRRAETWGLEEIRLDAPDPGPLSRLRAQRDAQRDQPGFGVLAGRDRVYPGEREDGEGTLWLMELGPDGRRLRQVEIGPQDEGIRTGPDDWPFNPPHDLHDPRYAAMEIGADEFEKAWRRARREPEGP